MFLFSEQSAKTDKTLQVFPEYNYYIQYMQPRFEKGQNTCPYSTKGCRETCLQTCGRLKFSKAKVERTDLYFDDPDLYHATLKAEIALRARLARKNTKQLVLRLNGTSDIDFSDVWKDKRYENIIFNEYTKNHDLAFRFLEYHKQGKYKNVNFVLSYSGKNLKYCKEYLKQGGNVAVVFEKELPKTFKGFEVIVGDKHDFRFKDAKGKIVGLLAKTPIGSKESKKDFIEHGIKNGFIIKQ